MHNISGKSSLKPFLRGGYKDILLLFVLRYDEEGFFPRFEIERVSGEVGMKLEPIAGESAWQMGKHSRHLQTLKEQMKPSCLRTWHKF